ncbi:MAG: hypothetical protein JNL62_25080, partial [Bryobacterales bacterium]|nr:hypothetical protein [Bryobacterales bacterium]
MKHRLLLVLMALPAALCAGWTTEVVASNVLPSAAAASNAKLQAAFRRTLTVNPYGVLIFVDHTAIAFEDQVSGVVKLARRKGNAAWTVDVVGNGARPSVKIDKFGYAHVSYVNSTHGFQYARAVTQGTGNCGGTNNFACEQIYPPLSTGQQDIEIAISNDNVVHAYMSNAYMGFDVYMKKPSAGVAFQLIFTSTPTRFSIAAASDNSLHWVTDSVPQPSTYLWHLRFQSWPTEVVGQAVDTGVTPMRLHIVLDSSNSPHICLTGTGGASSPLKYLRQNTDLSWSAYTALSAGAADCSIGLTSGNAIRIGYRDTNTNALMHAWRFINFWQVETVDTLGDV